MHTAAMVTQSSSVCYERKGLTLPGELLIVCVCGEPVRTASVSRVFSAGKKASEYLGQEPSMLPGLLIADVLLK